MTTLISVGSGKGGVGKSVLSSNIAMALAAKDYKVVLVDLDSGGADCHIMFGHFRPKHTLADFLLGKVDSLEEVTLVLSEFNNLRLIPGMGESMYTANVPTNARKKLVRHIKKINADFVVVDVGAGTSFDTLEYFMMSDLSVCIATPEPTSVLDLYRFVKLGVIRKALSVFLARDQIRKTIAKSNIKNISEIYALAEKAGKEKKAALAAQVETFRPFLVFNKVLPSKKSMYLMQLKKLLRDYLGVEEFPLLGEVPVDQSVEASVSEYIPVVIFAPESPASKVFVDIADKLVKESALHAS